MGVSVREVIGKRVRGVIVENERTQKQEDDAT
jgi:hypothetical protein